MSLSDWLARGWLTRYEPNAREIADLFGLIDRDLADCRASALSADWRLSIAYNAALQAATAALAAAGFRPARQAHHYRVVQSLRFTLGADDALVTQLDVFRRKRNISGYERAGGASEQEVKEIAALARRLRREVSTWIDRTRPDLAMAR